MKVLDNAKEVLDRFLADNPELEQLSARLATFNIFRALKVEDKEIRHSNTLGWLLDPAESHGLGDVFLRRILSNMLLASNADIEGLTAAQVELMDFGDIEVRREWKHIDVLVIDRGNKLVVLIENKIGSGEGAGQLGRYRRTVGEEFPSFKVVPVLLTLEGLASRDEEADDFISYNYSKLLDALKRIVEQRRSQMPEAVLMFLMHYMDTLRRLTMQDEELTALCQTIYRKHRKAIDLIVQYGQVSVFGQIASDVVGKSGDFEILHPAPTTFWFIPHSWAKVVPENGTAWTHLKRRVSVVCWLDLWRDKVSLVFEVSSMDDPALRLACVKQLSEGGFRLTKRAFKDDATYSRFFRVSHAVRDVGNEEEMRDTIDKVVGKGKEQFAKVGAILQKVFVVK